MKEKTKLLRQSILKEMGLVSARKPARKLEVKRGKYEYPRRFTSLGNSKGSTQGVAGWRSGYHRSDLIKLDGKDYTNEYLKYLRGNR